MACALPCCSCALQLEALRGRDARTLFLLETRLYDRRLLQASPALDYLMLEWHECAGKRRVWLAVTGMPACMQQQKQGACFQHLKSSC